MGLQIVDNMEGLRKAIIHLQEESIELATRIRDVLRGGRIINFFSAFDTRR